jgi:hypothetical protein
MEGNQPAPCVVALTDGRDCDVAVIRMAAGAAEIAQAPLRIFYANRFAEDKLRAPA